MKMVLLSSAILATLSIISLALARRVSRPIICIMHVIAIFCVSTSIILKMDSVWLIALSYFNLLAIYIAFIFFLLRIKYNFNAKIFSLRFLWHCIMGIYDIKSSMHAGERIVGRVIPYNNYQLRYNGKFITASEIATAGITLISGSIGSGKTFGIISWIKQNIDAGKSIIFSEYKGDPDVIKNIEKFVREYDSEYEVFVLSNGVSNFNYDPLKNLNNVGRIEALMNMRKWSIDGSDAHYKTSTQLLLQKLVGEFSKEYDTKLKNVDGCYTWQFYQFVQRYNAGRNEWDAYVTVSKLLELLITSSLRPMFEGKNEKTFNFDEIKNKKFILMVSFVSSNKELATSFSSLLFRDLLDSCTVEAPLQNVFLYIDEFGTLENPFIVKDLLEKGRSGKLATTLSLQDINQIIIKTNEAYLNSLLGIINTFIVYSGATRVTAEKFAGVQLLEIEQVLMNLRKPLNGKPPTAIYISKYPTLNKNTTSEVFRFEPFIYQPKNVRKNINVINSQQPMYDRNENIKEDQNINMDMHESTEHKSINVKQDMNENVDSSKHISYEDFI